MEQKTGITQRIGYGASVYGSVTLNAAGLRPPNGHNGDDTGDDGSPISQRRICEPIWLDSTGDEAHTAKPGDEDKKRCQCPSQIRPPNGHNGDDTGDDQPHRASDPDLRARLAGTLHWP